MHLETLKIWVPNQMYIEELMIKSLLFHVSIHAFIGLPYIETKTNIQTCGVHSH